jgi:hypothetical protein
MDREPSKVVLFLKATCQIKCDFRDRDPDILNMVKKIHFSSLSKFYFINAYFYYYAHQKSFVSDKNNMPLLNYLLLNCLLMTLV